MASKLEEWQYFRKELGEFPKIAEERLEQIQDGLRRYRVTLAGLEHRSEEIDNQIYTSYIQIQNEILTLNTKTHKRPLLFNSRKRLEELWLSWKNLLDDQTNLLDSITKAPDELKSYNNLQIRREQERLEQIKQEENLQEIASIRKSLGHAIEDLAKRDRDYSEVTLGSEVLKFEDVQTHWYEQLDESFDPDSIDSPRTEEILHHYYKLGETVRESPVIAKAVRSVEERFCELEDTHKSLVSIGNELIPEEELAIISIMLYEEIPSFWVIGEFDELDRVLQRIDNFINYYQVKVDHILSVEKQRRPGITNILALNPGDRSGDFDQLITLARSLVTAIDARDRFMQGHSDAVSRIALRIGRNLDWNQTDLDLLELAGLLHDVGKLNVPENILTKTGPLSPHEWSVIHMHPYNSAKIIKPVTRLNRIVPWVLSHQERWDGKGYPDHLAKNDIPMGSSIISIAESFSAMTMNMPNRNALDEDEALERIKRESGKQFNPKVVEAFLDAIEKKF